MVKPFLKPRNFCPNPVVKYGIPEYADGRANPNVIGSVAWREWWEEQLYYVLNGYITQGHYIPPRYYYFLNFCKTTSVDYGEPHYVDYVDFQYEYHLLIEEAKRLRMNLLVPKGGRKGLSVMQAAIIDWGYRFNYGYKAGIAAGSKEYSDDFLTKWKQLDSFMVDEFKVRKLSTNWDDIIAGWSEKTETGGESDFGTFNTIYSRTMHSNPNIFEGKFLNEVVFEEAGLFANLLETFDSAVECMKRGNIQYGTFYIYGRGGNIKTGSKGFEYMWNHPEDYNALKFPVLGKQYYLPCVAGTKDQNGIVIEDIPNLLKYEPYQRVGMEDTERAEELIKATNDKLLKAGNIKKWLKHSRDNPLTIQEFFQRANSNQFPTNLLNNQMYLVNTEEKKYSKYKMEFKKNSKGERIYPLDIDLIPAEESEEEDKCILILQGGLPIKDVHHIDVGGVDSYDQDQTMTTLSLGAMVVLRRDNNIQGARKMTPICIIRQRPIRKEIFYENCVKVAIYYQLYRGVLIDVAKPQIIKYFKDIGCESYLALRPRKYETPDSKQMHDYGVSINDHSKPLMLGLLQTYFFDYSSNIWFPMLLDEAITYDEKTKLAESDKDLIDALGIALMQSGSMEYSILDDNEEDLSRQYDVTGLVEDSSGNFRNIDTETAIWGDSEEARRTERARQRIEGY